MSTTIVFLGLSITSSWGNGHATNYRALARALTDAGHDVVFLERDVAWYASNRDLPSPPWGVTHLYSSLGELRDVHRDVVAGADLVVVGSYVPEGIAVARWVVDTARGATAFYDIDTPVTVAALARGECEYLEPALVACFDTYLSFTGGPILAELRDRFGARRPVEFPCMVDPDHVAPVEVPIRWDLGYLGTYSADRQPALDRLLVEPARRDRSLRAVVAGPQYPGDIDWPVNVERIDHVPPSEHPAFYCAQRAAVNVTRADMVRAGWSPSVRLFEAGACGVPVISDWWAGLDHYFVPGREILVADSGEEVLEHLRDDRRLERIGAAARAAVLARHTAAHRAAQLVDLASVSAKRSA